MPSHLAPSSRVVLLPTGRRDGLRPSGTRSPVVRRYRLARVPQDAAARSERFAHLKNAHD
jgi:hypothetical protein